jgi:short-subunit dehydrogenase
MKNFVLVTGASSGIGYEMAKLLAEKNFNLILVSRNKEKLASISSELSKKFMITVEYFPLDLSLHGAAVELFEWVQSRGFMVTHLVNNAGVGGYGNFIETSLDEELDMIQLNVISLVALTKLFAAEMAKRKSGRIMNVASLLSFIPFPYYAVYSATKTFVLAFSETVAAEMEDSGVVVTTLCPGTVETAFHTPEMRKTNAMHANKPVPAHVVAQAGIKLLLQGKGKKIVGLNNWIISNLPRVTPDVIMMKIKKNLASMKVG